MRRANRFLKWEASLLIAFVWFEYSGQIIHNKIHIYIPSKEVIKPHHFYTTSQTH